MGEYKIDFAALVTEMLNESLNKTILKAVPGDAKEKTQFYKLLTALNKRGVSTQTFLDAIMEATTEE